MLCFFQSKVTRGSPSGPLKASVMDPAVQTQYPTHPGAQDPVGAAYMGQYPHDGLQGPGYATTKPTNTKAIGNGMLMVNRCVLDSLLKFPACATCDPSLVDSTTTL